MPLRLLLLLRLLVRPARDRLRRVGHGGLFSHLLATFVIENRAHTNIDGKALPCVALVDAADRGHVAVIPAISHPDMPEADRLSERRVESDPLAARRKHFHPGVRGLSADHFLLLCFWCGRKTRNQIAGNVAGRNSLQPDDAEQEVREILADAYAERKRVDDRGVHMRGAFHVAESVVNDLRCGLGEASDGAIASVFCGLGNFRELRKMGHIAARRYEIEVIFKKLRAPLMNLLEADTVGWWRHGSRERAPRPLSRFAGADVRAEY